LEEKESLTRELDKATVGVGIRQPDVLPLQNQEKVPAKVVLRGRRGPEPAY
jgi:hypothetical protein